MRASARGRARRSRPGLRHRPDDQRPGRLRRGTPARLHRVHSVRALSACADLRHPRPDRDPDPLQCPAGRRHAHPARRRDLARRRVDRHRDAPGVRPVHAPGRGLLPGRSRGDRPALRRGGRGGQHAGDRRALPLGEERPLGRGLRASGSHADSTIASPPWPARDRGQSEDRHVISTGRKSVTHDGDMMSSPESRLRPEDETPLKGDGMRAAHPKDSDSSQAPASAQERTGSLLAAEKRTLEMIANGASLSEVLNDLCTAIDAHAPAAVSMVCLMDVDGKQLLPGAGPHVPAAFTAAITPWSIGPNRGSCGTAAFTKQRVIIPDISQDPRWPDEARDLALSHGFCAAWSEPLISKDGEVLGTFCVSYAEPRTPSSRDLELIEAAGNVARIAIERERSRVALIKALDEVKRSEGQLRNIFDSIPGFITTMSPGGEVETVNQQTLEYLGMTLDEMRDWPRILHEDDRQFVINTWRRSIETGESYDIQHRIRRADGVYRWFHVRGLAAHDAQGRIVRWNVLATDIDDRKRAEEELRREEQELRRMTDAIPQHIMVLAPDGIAMHANQSLLDYTGLILEDVMAPDFRTRFFHPEEVQQLRDERAKALARGLQFQNEQRARRRDGQYRWMLIHYNPFRDEQGRVVRWYATGIDIHDRKEAEERTRNENLALREEIDRSSMFEEIVGSSETLRRVLIQVSKVARTDSTVLILGETGT